jgi:hypothetical protein
MHLRRIPYMGGELRNAKFKFRFVGANSSRGAVDQHLKERRLKGVRMIIISGACIWLAKSAAEFFSRCGVASVNRKDTADEPDLAGPTVQFTTKS